MPITLVTITCVPVLSQRPGVSCQIRSYFRGPRPEKYPMTYAELCTRSYGLKHGGAFMGGGGGGTGKLATGVKRFPKMP